MRRIEGSIGIVLALSVMAVSAVCNARYGMSLAREGIDSGVMIAVAGFADVGKAVCWIYFARALVRREWLAAGAALAIFGGCLLYAVAGSLGYVAMHRAQSTAGVAAKGQDARALESELARKEATLSALGVVEPVAAIGKQIEALKQDRRFMASAGCSEPSNDQARSFCAGLARLEASHKKAEAVMKLEDEIEVLRAERRAMGGVAQAEKGDFQSALIAQLSGVNIPTVQLSMALVFVFVVETGSCFLLWLSLNHLAGDQAARTRPAQVADLGRFVEENLALREGGEVCVETLKAAFVTWCGGERLQPLAAAALDAGLQEFRRVGGLGQHTRGGKTYLAGVVMTTGYRNDGRDGREQ